MSVQGAAAGSTLQNDGCGSPGADAGGGASTAGAGRLGWCGVGRGAVTCINWHLLLRGDRSVDPYLLWAEMTDFRGFGGLDAVAAQRLTFLVEIAASHSTHGRVLVSSGPGQSLTTEQQETVLLASLIEISGLTRRVGAHGAEVASRFLTARVSASCLRTVLCSPAVARAQLALARLPVGQAPLPVEGFLAGEQPRTVMGFIDDGCAFAHPAFCDRGGSTRVHYLWDQDPRREATSPWHAVPQAGYGAEARHEDLAHASRIACLSGDDMLAYRWLNYGPVKLEPWRYGSRFQARGRACQDLPPGTMRRASHGSAVMYLAAGADRLPDGRYEVPLALQRAVAADVESGPGAITLPVARSGPGGVNGSMRPDDATNWPIIFVQLPTQTILDTSGGSLGACVLDGVDYIVGRARGIPYDQAPLVDGGSATPAVLDAHGRVVSRNAQHRIIINISYGALAGPHDGTSLLEDALMDRVARESRLWICVAAGNSGRARGHASLELGPGDHGWFSWVLAPDNPHQGFLEIWLPDQEQVPSEAAGPMRGPAALDPDRFRISVLAPGAVAPQTLTCGQARLLCARDANGRDVPVAMAAFCRRVVQGRHGTMCLVAAMPTGLLPGAPSSDAVLAPHGTWAIEVSRAPDAAAAGDRCASLAVVHAWVERDDLLYGNVRGQQSSVYASDVTPEPTEYMREAIRRLRREQTLGRLCHEPQELQSPRTFSNLSSKSIARLTASGRETRFWAPAGPTGAKRGTLVIASGENLADGEVPRYASGGPGRPLGPTEHSIAVDPGLHFADQPRDRPDVSAPTDVGPALPGVRVVGMRAGTVSRLSGTSAAAPTVARFIANAEDGSSMDAAPAVPQSEVGWAARPTHRPRSDDAFRRGDYRIRIAQNSSRAKPASGAAATGVESAGTTPAMATGAPRTEDQGSP